jgi:hypothetical protein
MRLLGRRNALAWLAQEAEGVGGLNHNLFPSISITKVIEICASALNQIKRNRRSQKDLLLRTQRLRCSIRIDRDARAFS